MRQISDEFVIFQRDKCTSRLCVQDNQPSGTETFTLVYFTRYVALLQSIPGRGWLIRLRGEMQSESTWQEYTTSMKWSSNASRQWSTSEIMAWINALSMTHSTCDRFSVLFLHFFARRMRACVMQKNSSSIDLVLFSYDVELVAGFLTVTYRSLKLKHVVKGSCLMVRHWIHLVVFLQWSLNLSYS